MKQPWFSLGSILAVAALAACSQVGGGSLVPGAAPGRVPSLRAIPVHPTPTPTPTPGRNGGESDVARAAS